MYGVCFWLVMGYCFLGYGIRQYQPLNIPPYCQSLDISWQTDPRRPNFVRMQVIIFVSASVGFLVALIAYVRPQIREYRELKEEQRRHAVPTEAEAAARARREARENAPKGYIEGQLQRFGEWKGGIFASLPKGGEKYSVKMPQLGRFGGNIINVPIPELHASEFLVPVVMAFVVLPFIAGFLMAIVLNSHKYLLLGQEGCYASYVSSCWGYLDLQLLNFRIKLATWLGLNT
jgi:hypothetical protein